MTWEKQLAELAEYYPGSKQRIVRGIPEKPSKAEEDQVPEWLTGHRSYLHDNGKHYEMFSVRHVALALNRAAVTIRDWERKGIIPLPKRGPSEFWYMRHRIYSRPQVEGMRRIAEEEGILDPYGPSVTTTNFQERVLSLYKELAPLPLFGAREADPPKRQRKLRLE